MRLGMTNAPTQIAQAIMNVEHFQFATSELEEQLTKLRFVPHLYLSFGVLTGLDDDRASQRGGRIHLLSIASFETVLQQATDRLGTVIKKKLDDIFELSEYNWTPVQPESEPSMYLDELLNWLMTVVDTMVLEEVYKDGAYRAALEHVAGCFMVCFQPCVYRFRGRLTGIYRTFCLEEMCRQSTRMESQTSLLMLISSSRGLRNSGDQN